MLLIEREDGMIEGSGADKAIDTLCSTRLNGCTRSDNHVSTPLAVQIEVIEGRKEKDGECGCGCINCVSTCVQWDGESKTRR